MAHEFTKAQKAAIEEKGRTLLVSAAAGSGKTAVLTERIIRTITDSEDPVDITDLLIVTFTVDAAGEMRHRISKKLNEKLAECPDNKHILKQLMLLGSAHISTIDAFYLDLVKANFEAAGLSPTLRLADDSELLTLQREIMNTVVDQMYRDEPDFCAVADLLSDIKEETSLTERLLGIAKKLQTFPEGPGVLLASATAQEALAGAPFSGPIGEPIRKKLTTLAAEGRTLFAKTAAMLAGEPEALKLTARYLPYLTERETRCVALSDALVAGDADGVAALLKAPFTSTLGKGAPPRRTEAFAHRIDLCKKFSKLWEETASDFSAFDSREIEVGGRAAAKLLRLIYQALDAYETAYFAAKAEREVAEFHDIARAAYRLLVNQNGEPTPLAASVAASYRAIYIDEYQDVSAMQDATFRAISTPHNRFMVGDIKQSIYRFRSADPAVFAGYRRAFPDLSAASAGEAATIFMSNCFRCDENVVRFSNTVSGYLFGKSRESIGYTAADDLVFSKALPTPDYRSPKCRVMRVVPPGKEEQTEDGTKASAEARMVAAEIGRLLREEKKADGTPFSYRDIAVFCRSHGPLDELAELLRDMGIPSDESSKRNFFENPEVLCMYNLLAVIDNPMQDIYLAGVLRSPFFGFSLSDLIAVRGAGEEADSLYEAIRKAAETAALPLRERCAAFLQKLAVYRKKAIELSVDKLLRYLYRDTAVLSFSGDRKGEGGGADRRANLLRLYEYARKFEAGGFKGLYRFVRYVEDIMRNNTEMKTPDSGADAVKLTTIHKSKGLEFPACFIIGCSTRFHNPDLSKNFLLDSDMGAAVRVPNAGAFSRANTYARAGVAAEMERKDREEEMRILYVAMTRARERLYMTGKLRGKPENALKNAALRNTPVTDLFALEGSCYMDWILSALSGTTHDDFCESVIIPEEELLPLTAKEGETMPKDVAPDTDFAARLMARDAFVYPYRHLTKLPAKLSVSRLAPTVLDVYDSADSATPADLAAPDSAALLDSFSRTPLFGAPTNKAEGAAAGTATHEFLQFCDFERVRRKGTAAELAYLIEARFLPPDTGERIRMDELETFFRSDFFHMLCRARDLHRETRFNILLPAADFTADPAFRRAIAEETLLVQGVIDLFFTDEAGNLVLCDYKTDRLSPYECAHPAAAAEKLFARHGTQLRYYGEALARLCGRYPDKTLIYSLPLGAAIEAPIGRTKTLP